MRKPPDRTGLLIQPSCALIIAVLSSAMLAYGLWLEPRPSPTLIDAMVRAAAGSLGVPGVAAVAVVTILSASVWLRRARLTYRARVAADELRRATDDRW